MDGNLAAKSLDRPQERLAVEIAVRPACLLEILSGPGGGIEIDHRHVKLKRPVADVIDQRMPGTAQPLPVAIHADMSRLACDLPPTQSGEGGKNIETVGPWVQAPQARDFGCEPDMPPVDNRASVRAP